MIQSGTKDRRGPLTKAGPKYLRWAMLDAKVAQIDIARRLTTAIWHMLTTNQPFNPTAAGGAAFRLAA